MVDADEKPKLKVPGPIWAWLLAAIAIPQFMKRVFIGWPLPKAKDFDFGSRLMENFVTDALLGLPVLAAFLVALLWVNRRPGS